MEGHRERNRDRDRHIMTFLINLFLRKLSTLFYKELKVLKSIRYVQQ